MSNITVETITPDTTGNSGLDTGVKASGSTGGATEITVQALFNDISIGEKTVKAGGDSWSCNVTGEFTPPGTLTVKASDPDGSIGSGEKSIDVKE